MRPPLATSAWPSSTTPSGSIGISQRGASSRSTVCMTESKAGTVELEARSLTEARPSAAMPVVESVRPIIWERTHLRLLDQRLLPAEVRYLDCRGANRSEEHTSELQSLMRISYAVF